MTAERLACLLLGEKIGASVQRIVQAGTDYDEAIYATPTSGILLFLNLPTMYGSVLQSAVSHGLDFYAPR